MTGMRKHVEVLLSVRHDNGISKAVQCSAKSSESSMFNPESSVNQVSANSAGRHRRARMLV